MSLVVRAIRLDEIQTLQDFVRDHWNAEHAFVKSEKLLCWQHFDNPFKAMSPYADDELSFMGAWEGNRLIAALGEIPLPFTCRGQDFLGSWLALWKNCDAERYPSAGIQLLHHIPSGPAEFIGGIGMHPRVRQAYGLFKFRICDELPLYLVINPEVRSQLIARKPGWTRQAGERFLAREKSGIPDARVLLGEPKHAEADDWDQFWSRTRGELLGVDRRFEYMNWRYLSHPYYRYDWVRIPGDGGGLEAAAVYRVESVGDKKVMHVVEFTGSDAGKSRLAGALCERMRQLDASFLGFRCSQVARFEPWHEHGGGVYGKDDEALEVPSLFQPVVPEYHPLAWVYRLAERHAGVAPEDCYITRSDGDQDRPAKLRLADRGA